MTENDPSATGPSGTPDPSGADAGGWQPQSEPNPWSAQGAAGAGPAGQPGQPDEQAAYSGQSGYAGQQAHSPYAGTAQGYPYQPAMHGVQQQTYPTQTYPTPPPTDRRRGSAKLVAGVAVLALLVGGGAGAAGGYLAADGSGGSSVSALDAPKPAKQTGNAKQGSVESVSSSLMKSVVQLQVAGQQGTSEGSGFIISSDGYVLTNNHVIEGAADGGQITAVFQNGQKTEASVVGRDPTTDIAVVKVDGQDNLPTVELGRSDDLNVGQSVVAIGSPYELAGTVTSGIVSSLHRPVTAGGGGQSTVMDAIQTDAAINPGNSGGPLANMSGQVIGINSAIYSPQSSSGGFPGQQQQSEGGNVGIGFAIPIDQARRTADDIIKSGHATQTYIGAGVIDAPNGGASLSQIENDSPAAKAGLKAGDVVTKIDDRNIEDSDTLVAAVRTKAPGEKVTFTLENGNTVECTLGGKPVTG